MRLMDRLKEEVESIREMKSELLQEIAKGNLESKKHTGTVAKRTLLKAEEKAAELIAQSEELHEAKLAEVATSLSKAATLV